MLIHNMYILYKVFITCNRLSQLFLIFTVLLNSLDFSAYILFAVKNILINSSLSFGKISNVIFGSNKYRFTSALFNSSTLI